MSHFSEKDASNTESLEQQEPEFALVNNSVEFSAKANCKLNALNPKPGSIALGDGGIDFIAASGYGFISIPWNNIQKVRVDVYGKFVRSIEVVTDDDQVLPFILSKGYDALHVIYNHIGREKIVSSNRSFGSHTV
ncbi:DUF956 family protein [Atopobium fossor]|uniref:DUF956 family protein n=1 Tax=Atopobium fossor TaxID=39487 RepID=UPI00146F9BC2|nr:DUF956 family protein [Atopobium fossor]